MDELSGIKREELQSLKQALGKCKFVKDEHGAFSAEADGWMVVFGREETGEYVGFALNAAMNVQIEFSSDFIERMMNKVHGLN